MVGGVTPGRGGQEFEGIPIFNTVAEAVEKTGADATMIFVPPPVAADAIMEAADAGIRVVDRHHRRHPGSRHGPRRGSRPPLSDVRLIGPNCPGVITPERVQDRHHARLHPQARPGRRHEPFRHADLRGRLAVDEPRPWPIDVRRHRRRPDRRHVVHRSFGDVRGRPEDGSDLDDGRDRRHGRGGGGGLSFAST